MKRSLPPLLALAGLAGLWVTWASPAIAALGVGALTLVAAGLLRGSGLAAWVGLGAAAALAAAIPDQFFGWRPWANAVLLVIVMDSVLRGSYADPPGVVTGTLIAGAAMLLVGVGLYAWRPAFHAFAGAAGAPAAALLLAGVGAALAIMLRGSDDRPDREDPAAP